MLWRTHGLLVSPKIRTAPIAGHTRNKSILFEKVMSMPGIMTRRAEVTTKTRITASKKGKRKALQKREMPTRHSLLTDVAVADLEDEHTKASKPQFSASTIIRVSSDPAILKGCDMMRDANISLQETGQPERASELQKEIKVPWFRTIDHKIPPASMRTVKNASVVEETDDETYLRRHRKHEMAEKRVKNREKEQLRYGMHQQMRYVERLKSMNRTNLLATLSSRLRRDGIGELDEAEVKSLHQRMIREAEELLMRYEALGLLSSKQKIEYSTIAPKNDTHRMPELEQPSQTAPSPPSIEPEATPAQPSKSSRSQPRKRIKLADKDENRSAVTSRSTQKKASQPPPKTVDGQPKPRGRRSKKFSFAKSTPSISRREFSLPVAEFGELMRRRSQPKHTQ